MDDDLPPVVTNEDWEATCLIYDDDSSICVEYTNYSTKNKEHTALCGCTRKLLSLHAATVASLELPAVRTMQTAIFACREPLHPGFYRFWSMQESGRDRVRLRVLFLYDGAENGDDESFPVAVSVSLASQYPVTWPIEEKGPWLAWLNVRVQSILEEELTSYSVSDFVDHNALEYFNPIHRHEECVGSSPASIVMFSTTATHWQNTVDSLLYNPVTGILMHHRKDGTKSQVYSTNLWPESEAKNEDPLTRSPTKPSDSKEGKWLDPFILQHENWLPVSCPICFDDFMVADMIRLPCDHLVCRECFAMYAKVQVSQIGKYRLHDLPFRCPITSCNKGIPVVGTIKAFLTPSEMDTVRLWYVNLKHPRSNVIPICLDCANGKMRKEDKDFFWVYCEACEIKRCEYCVTRIRDCSVEHLASQCEGAKTLKFARRYSRASPEIQKKCEDRYPWIKVYAEVRVNAAKALKEFLETEKVQVCPQCSHGVLRSEGCFHIHCNCGTHFCYECGEELFPPYYGTHHCWENSNLHG